jgi:hypothetical protein
MALGATAAVLVPLAIPVLPVTTFVSYARTLGVAPGTTENNQLGALPQFYADMFGWPEKAAAVAGVYNRLTPEEKVMFDAIIDRLNQDFEFNKSSDFLQVELVGVYSVKLVRAQIEGNTDAAEKLDRMIRCHMKDLKTTKIAREGEEPKGPQTSPAEWAAALLEKVAEAANAPATKTSGRKKRGKNCG